MEQRKQRMLGSWASWGVNISRLQDRCFYKAPALFQVDFRPFWVEAHCYDNRLLPPYSPPWHSWLLFEASHQCKCVWALLSQALLSLASFLPGGEKKYLIGTLIIIGYSKSGRFSVWGGFLILIWKGTWETLSASLGHSGKLFNKILLWKKSSMPQSKLS